MSVKSNIKYAHIYRIINLLLGPILKPILFLLPSPVTFGEIHIIIILVFIGMPVQDPTAIRLNIKYGESIDLQENPGKTGE